MADRLPSTSFVALGVLRIASGLLFLQHGTQKFLYFPPGERAGSGLNFADLSAFAGLIELVGGVLLVLGLFTRSAAFIASGTMAVAYWLAHGSQGFFPILNGGELAALYCFVFLYIFFAGPGAWSLDGIIARQKREARAASEK